MNPTHFLVGSCSRLRAAVHYARGHPLDSPLRGLVCVRIPAWPMQRHRLQCRVKMEIPCRIVCVHSS
jgi:hypothetical protein